jgi:hypothetical protein
MQPSTLKTTILKYVLLQNVLIQYKSAVGLYLAFYMKNIKRRISYREVVEMCSPDIYKYDIKTIPDSEKEDEYELDILSD